MAFAEGQSLGPYRIVSRLGQGGMATVYKGYHARLDRHVAIKVIHQAFVQDAASIARFEREAQIVARLDHPNIVPIYDFSEHEGQPYLVMKHIDGMTLKALLSQAPLTLESIISLMTAVAGAVDYAHSQGVLHRDIKPSNILIDREGVAYVTDFGLARIAHAAESTLSENMLLGTPQYISPEQAMGNRDLTPQSDLYSLAIVLYELVVGRVPFTADTPYAIVHEQIYSPLPPPRELNPNISPAIEAVLMKALSKNPADRYASAAAMVEAFRVSLADVDPDTLSLPLAPAKFPLTPPAAQPQTAAPVNNRVEKPKRTDGENVEFRFDFAQLGDQLRDMFEGIEEAVSGDDAAARGVPSDEEQSIRRRIEQGYKKRGEFFTHLAVYGLIIMMMFVIYGFTGGFNFNLPFGFGEFPWPLIVAFGWGAGLAAHAVDTYFQTGARAATQDRIVDQAMREKYGDGWQRTVGKKEYSKTRHNALKPYKKRVELLEHVAVFFPINLMLWFIYLSSGGGDFPWPLIVSLGWGAGFVGHVMDAFFGSDVQAARREQAVQREVERELQRRDSVALQKPKRTASVRLNEDGELTDSIAEAWELDEQPRRSKR
jgi:tRNA A-37 threonylcarbamoyl transferase component Bud32